ncbi:hypothetical protein Cha6605_3163 [Chamaesiphon minutus PCC 6605]|uniref:Uncharacterized protein n=1 Tax=Chamaesiphon minutus (strain ATCC 27169 / PCC 6605) TaxID=1173020 RepID=K9UGD3_CHAP6|nr:hypothetical protein Cha6605_3163 [Chamaesiphon minutus PCC 6605]
MDFYQKSTLYPPDTVCSLDNIGIEVTIVVRTLLEISEFTD